jgi:hypothetical protein
VWIDGQEQRLLDCRTNFEFKPAPGWIGHIERMPEARRA